MVPPELAGRILSDLRSASAVGPSFRSAAMKALSELPGYDWSGIYRLEGETLVLDEFVGDATDHTRIPVGVGVCGTAVKENRNQIVEDVRTLENYLSCSARTRSEIVVLIRRGSEILGQIDVDGHAVAAFDQSDEGFLKSLAELIGQRWD